MTVLRERIDTSLPLDEAFAFVADFANAERWDPGVASSIRMDPGPVGVGARYRLGVRMGGRVSPMDECSAAGDGTRIDYTADIRLVGLLRFAGPVAGGALAGVGSRAREGMRVALDRLATGA